MKTFAVRRTWTGRRLDAWAARGAAAANRLTTALASRLNALSAAIAPTDAGVVARLQVEHGRVVAASPQSVAPFGAAARRGATLEAVAAGLRADEPAIAEALTALHRSGVGFCRVAQAGAGRYLIRGAPRGAQIVIEAIEAGAVAEALTRGDAALAAAGEETATLREALNAAREEARAVRRDAAIAARAAAQRQDARAPGAGGVASEIETTFSQLRIGIAAFDADRRLTVANPAFFEAFGLSAGDFGATPTLRAVTDVLRERRIAPEHADFGAWRESLFDLFDPAAPDAAFDERWELPDHRVLHVVGRPCGAGAAFTIEDVSAAVEMERWRTTALKSRAMTLDALLDGVVELGPDGSVRACNSAFLRLWNLDGGQAEAPRTIAALAEACAPLTPDGRIWDALRRAVSGSPSEIMQQRRVRLADQRVLEARVARMPDGKTVAAFTDVTDSERVADALRERAAFLEAADAMRASTLYEISHGLRTPISAVMGFADLLASDADARTAGYARSIRDAAAAMREGVERLSELVAAGSPSVDEVSRSISVTPMLHSAAALLERRLAERPARFDFSDAPGEAIAYGDPARVRQLIFAMLSEALDRVRPGGVIRVRAAADADTLTLTCEDEGLRVADAASTAFAMAQRTASMHGASLALESGPGGVGMVVYRTPGAAR